MAAGAWLWLLSGRGQVAVARLGLSSEVAHVELAPASDPKQRHFRRVLGYICDLRCRCGHNYDFTRA